MTANASEKLALREVNKVFATTSGEEFQALTEINLSVADGEFVAFIGPSGGGKSTLLFVIAGLEYPTSGEVIVNGNSVKGPGRDRGLIFQEDAIFMWRRVLGNVEYGLEMAGMSKKKRREIAEEYIDMVGLMKFREFFPKELSGGMRKRVAIATVFANNPEILLMDEPFGSLDYGTKLNLHEALQDIWQKHQKTTIFVTHDVEEALFLADRIVVVKEGRIATELAVPFGRPRLPEVRFSAEMQESKKELWGYMHDES